MKRSTTVALTLIGLPVAVVAAAPLIPPGEELHRNLYADRAGCERDYSLQQCQPRSGSGTGAVWYGPYYSANRSAPVAASDPGPGRTGQVTRTEASTRGGFGAFGRTMRAVG